MNDSFVGLALNRLRFRYISLPSWLLRDLGIQEKKNNMTREEDIERVIEKLRVAWLNYPEQRLCQLVWNIANNIGDMPSRDCFHVRDTPFEIELNKWFKKKSEEVAQKT